MSSAKQGLRRVGIGGLAALVGSTIVGLAFAAPANATLAPAGGQIGIVDTSTGTSDNTNGATLIEPGKTGQSVADIALLVPHQFDAGDTIDLALFDRTATLTQKGQTNADAAHSLGWSGTPTVTVDTTPYNNATNIGPTSNAGNDVLNGHGTAHGALLKPDPAPQFTATLVSSSRATGTGAKDILRLTLNNQDLSGDPTGKWLVKLSGLKMDVGSGATPGAVRVIPFAYNGAPATDFSNKVGTFAGNAADTDNNPATWDPTINTYTVPAFIDPVDWSVAAPTTVAADSTAQSIGDISIKETAPYSLQAGTYGVQVGGTSNATVANTASDPITVTISGGASVTVGPVTFHETVTTPATIVPGGFTFVLGSDGPLGGQQNRTTATITVHGLLLKATTPGSITYRLRGGSIDANGNNNLLGNPPEFAGDAGTVGLPNDPTFPFGLHGVPAESAILTGGDINQTDIEAPQLVHTGQATSLSLRIGGEDRYGTAAKAALSFAGCTSATCPNGVGPRLQSIVLASGENFPDAMSGNYLATSQQTGILLTRAGSLPQVTEDAICELGVQRVFIVGGTTAISSAVENHLKGLEQHNAGCNGLLGSNVHLAVTRLAGPTRYQTNKTVDEYASANNLNATAVGLTNFTFGSAAKRTAIVATGENFPDALAAGPATFFGNFPIVLTPGAALGADAASTLNDLGIQQAVIVGGTDVVSTATETSITSGGAAVQRVAGADRYETATKLADLEILPFAATSTRQGGFGFDGSAVPPANNSQRAFLATGQAFADALAGGPVAGQSGSPSPILLTTPTPLSPVTQTWLSDHAAAYVNVQALGLAQAVSDAALSAANAAVSSS